MKLCECESGEPAPVTPATKRAPRIERIDDHVSVLRVIRPSVPNGRFGA